eukprot:TRINITY_DN771_c0_g1_i17.p1 TRINITY_DN771_c0_g1~~TRINITY_DN771_c0_g1_i17.p1  ORF type:complete len:401 (+),score=120.55 TRINITY_DN771_c0_g1_i17:66-1268(+)
MCIRDRFRGKTIRSVHSGFNYYVAVEREEVDSIDNWTNEKVLKWAEEIGLDKYLKIIKYEKIEGKHLWNANKQFLHDTLGLKREDLHTKILCEIAKYREMTYKPQILHGWGANSNGQLGFFNGCNILSNVVRLPSPTLDADDEIISVNCGWKNTMVATRSGKIFITNNMEGNTSGGNNTSPSTGTSIGGSAGTNSNANNGQGNNATSTNNNGNSNGSRKGRQNNNANNNNNKDQNGVKGGESSDSGRCKNTWLDISPTFQTLKDKRCYRIIEISICREFIGVLSEFVGMQKEQRKKIGNLTLLDAEANPKHNGKSNKDKFRDFQQVLNRLQWDPKLAQEEFMIGVEDSKLGFTEYPYADFLCMEIVQTRVKYIKQNGEVVWDRTKKICKIQEHFWSSLKG